MSEGQVYLCASKEINGCYTLTLQANSSITSQGENIEKCMDEVCLKILDWNGDDEAVLELLPPIRKKLNTGLSLFSLLSYNDSVNAVTEKSLYNEGDCEKCRHGVGKRNDSFLEVDVRPTGPVVGVLGCYPSVKIYSMGFIELLTGIELDQFSTRPVLFNASDCGYVELFPEYLHSQVGHIGARYPSAFQQSWKCSACGRESFIARMKGFDSGTIFLDPNSIEGIVSSMLFVRTGMADSMALRNDRWGELLKACKGLVSNSVVVLEPEYIETPILEEPAEFDWI